MNKIDGLHRMVEINEVGLNEHIYSAQGMEAVDLEDAFKTALFRCLTRIKDMNSLGGSEICFFLNTDLPNNTTVLDKLVNRLKKGDFEVCLNGDHVRVRWRLVDK